MNLESGLLWRYWQPKSVVTQKLFSNLLKIEQHPWILVEILPQFYIYWRVALEPNALAQKCGCGKTAAFREPEMEIVSYVNRLGFPFLSIVLNYIETNQDQTSLKWAMEQLFTCLENLCSLMKKAESYEKFATLHILRFRSHNGQHAGCIETRLRLQIRKFFTVFNGKVCKSIRKLRRPLAFQKCRQFFPNWNSFLPFRYKKGLID